MANVSVYNIEGKEVETIELSSHQELKKTNSS